MSVETVAVWSIGKWLIGLVLAPWLWYEKKKREELQRQLDTNYYTKTEVEQQMDLRDNLVLVKLEVIHTELKLLRRLSPISSAVLSNLIGSGTDSLLASSTVIFPESNAFFVGSSAFL